MCNYPMITTYIFFLFEITFDQSIIFYNVNVYGRSEYRNKENIEKK